MIQTVTIVAEYARRIPDPVFRDRHMERHVLFCRAKNLPDGLPKDPNPRHQNIDRGIYKDVRRSLLNEFGTPSTFHLKNKGITIIADDLRDMGKGRYELVLQPGQGIVDGAHTYEIVRSSRSECPEEQFVRLEVLTGIEETLVPEIAGGLNTAMQVQEMSLANLSGQFQWLRKAMSPEYARGVAFRENETGAVDARDVVALLTLFNVELFPIDGQEYPIRAYTSKEQTLDLYLKKKDSYERMDGIVNDILLLHDWLHLVARDEHNKAGGRAGRLAFMKSRKRGYFVLPFTRQETKFMLYDGALYPMLGAFRWMVRVEPKSRKMVWKPSGGISAVVDLLKRVCGELMRSTQDRSNQLGRNPNAIGKDRGHWENLFKTVALRDMQE